MNASPIRRVVILGGGTAGWISAALLGRAFGSRLAIRLIESDAIGTVGVGEATIPQIQHINRFLGLDEREVLKASQGTYKLGIQFNDWGRVGDSYLHAFGDIGLPLGLIPFQHYWLRDRQERSAAASQGAAELWAYSINARACHAGRMARMERIGDTPLTGLRHAYHLDAGLYARFLRAQCDPTVVQRIEGKVVDVALREDDGFIQSLLLESGERIEGDLFIDCSGFRGLLIEETLHAGYDDWKHWLPCDRAMAVASTRVAPMRPYTQASARAAGWQWRIPLQHRSGNGHVYSSDFISDDEATATLLSHLEGEAMGEPRPLRFQTGCRRRFWHRNCIAIGLAAGFMEPLESTGIHLIQSAVSRLISLFPDSAFDAAMIDAYNRQTRFEYERIRDFLILHYRATERRDTPFWRHCAQIEPPESLRRKLDVFRASAQLFRDGEELFTDVGWLQVLIGQHVQPQRHHPLANAVTPAQLDEFLTHIRTLLDRAIDSMPSHDAFIERHCKAPPLP
ncbi:tryptophan halogenase family protein [Oleiagrimonas soli]|uniref:Tryptophan halogenase n=1 Tax=Oleiagrimonas soli TaxID=1543381 RepID=A0A099CT63_9GAMM|nr:tryptophan halogenase family protein [Oleiagrimonas soli]KGI76871.1 tryptophan halogenase [Oleiagrimonas soli]MBB6185272.1 tryptophan halogenase [Oleiagrimonas soli]